MSKLPKKVETPFDVLAVVLALAQNNDYEGAWEVMELAQKAAIALEDSTTFNLLYGATAIKLTWGSELAERKRVVKRNRNKIEGGVRLVSSFGGGSRLQS